MREVSQGLGQLRQGHIESLIVDAIVREVSLIFSSGGLVMFLELFTTSFTFIMNVLVALFHDLFGLNQSFLSEYLQRIRCF